MKSSQAKLDELAQEIIDRDVCPDLRAQASRLVMGSGNPDADIFLIGEAPGEEEDQRGLPFVGASGKFLNVMFEAAGMNRDDVYITNIVKYRPPNNRDPSEAEKAEFAPYLQRQIEIVNPKVVISLGRHSMEYFLPKEKISKAHGQVYQVQQNGRDITVAPLYHPAYALYGGSKRQALIDDFLKVTLETGSR